MSNLVNRSDTVLPGFDIKLGGVALLHEAECDVFALEVVQDLRWPGTAAIHFFNEKAPGQPTWSASSLFAPGVPLEIQFGYQFRYTEGFKGEITGLEVELDGVEGSSFVVRAHDLRHRLLTGRRSRTFVKMRDSAIVAKIGRDAGLTVAATQTAANDGQVVQRDQSDLAFIHDRADRLGYDLTYNYGGGPKAVPFRFGPRRTSSVVTVVLAAGATLLSFSGRVSTVGRSRTVVVRGFNPATGKEPYVATRLNRDPALAHVVAATTPATVVTPLESAAEAVERAEAQVQAMAASLTGRGSCIGNPALVPGALVRIDGLGGQFSAFPYRVTSARHVFGADGYSTEFDVVQEASP